MSFAANLDPSEFVDPPGYPFTSMEYLKVFDSFLGGFKMYEDFPVARTCMESLEKRYMTLEYTYYAWTEVNLLNEGFTKYDNATGEAIYNIWPERLETKVYNLSEGTSQYLAPIVNYCSLFGYRFGAFTYGHFTQFPSINYFLLSGLSHFLGKVFTINNYFTKYEYAVQVNDVDQQWNYLGRILNVLVIFPVLEFEDVEDPTLNWEDDEYRPYNQTNFDNEQTLLLVKSSPSMFDSKD